MIKVKLCDIAEIYQGNILTRIKPISALDEVEIDTISMQELSYYVGISDDFVSCTKSKISKAKMDSCILTKQNDIIVGLSSRKTMVIEEERSNKLLLSNFATIRLKSELVNPYYLCWLFNENLQFQKYIEQKVQGSANVFILPISMLKDLEIELPSIEIQAKIGELYNLYRQKERKSKQLLEKEKLMINNQLNKIIKL